MEYFTNDYKKFLAYHFVVDSWQFIMNTRKNIVTAGYCYHVIHSLISKMAVEHQEWQKGINNDLTKQMAEKGPIY